MSRPPIESAKFYHVSFSFFDFFFPTFLSVLEFPIENEWKMRKWAGNPADLEIPKTHRFPLLLPLQFPFMQSVSVDILLEKKGDEAEREQYTTDLSIYNLSCGLLILCVPMYNGFKICWCSNLNHFFLTT